MAAVLVGIINRSGELHLLLTERSKRMRTHAGEVAFPGGRANEGEDPWTTALREAHEEVSLDPELVGRVGGFNPTVSRFGVAVFPCVGVIDPVAEYSCDHCPETEHVFEVPIDWLIENFGKEEDTFDREGKSYKVPVWNYGEHRIWGLTANMIASFLGIAFDVPNRYAWLHK